ncbi:hypothetical protein [Streptomyces sp. NBC_00344]|uniref:hypothetical protein n=1 Tax=Streptomyces sp. NBC_00344 TaxID=2975720 RepID=UPI002E1EB01F
MDAEIDIIIIIKGDHDFDDERTKVADFTKRIKNGSERKQAPSSPFPGSSPGHVKPRLPHNG